MPKAEWGTKRMCASCGVRFYDFARSEVACPACQAPYDLEQASRVRRTRMGVKAVAEVADDPVKSQTAKAAGDDEEDEEEAEEEHEFAAEDESEAEIDGDMVKAPAEETTETTSDDDEGEEDQSLIEDASELGDDDDVSDVIESDIDGESDDR